MPFDIPSSDGYGVLWTINRRQGPASWEDFYIDPDNADPLSGFHVTLTGYTRSTVTTTDPDTGQQSQETEVIGRALTGVSLSFTCVNRDDAMFTPAYTNRLFTSTSSPVQVGITTTSYYEWEVLFDQSTVKYIPGNSVGDAFTSGADEEVGPVEGLLPEVPVDASADPPVYPMDTFTSFRPDDRTSITLEFTATVSCNVSGGGPVTETVNWTQTVFQKPYDWGKVVNDALNDTTYFTNGYTSDKR